MPSTLRKVGAAAVALVLIATAAALSVERDPDFTPGERGAIEAMLWPSAEAPRRRDQHGDRLTPGALRDRIVVLSFVSADCTIVCAVRTLDLHKLAETMPEALRDRVVFLAVDTDPARDDAARLRAFSDGLLGTATRLRLLTSDAAGLSAALAPLRYPPAALPEPPPTVLVFDRRGQAAMAYGGDPVDGPRLLRDVALLDTFEHGIGRPARSTATPF